MLIYANCHDTVMDLRTHSHTYPINVALRLMACVNVCFVADGPSKPRSEMS